MAVDGYGNPNAVASGELIEAAWGNAVEQRVVSTFPTFAVLSGVTLPVGTVAITLDTLTLFRRSSSGWIALAPASGSAIGPPGNYATGTDFIIITIPSAPTPRLLSFTYVGLIGSQVGQLLDIVSSVDGAATGTWRCQAGITQSVCLARQGVSIAANAAHTLKITNVGSTVTLVNDPSFNVCTWQAAPSL